MCARAPAWRHLDLDAGAGFLLLEVRFDRGCVDAGRESPVLAAEVGFGEPLAWAGREDEADGLHELGDGALRDGRELVPVDPHREDERRAAAVVVGARFGHGDGHRSLP
jgi:hypothetical protein